MSIITFLISCGLASTKPKRANIDQKTFERMPSNNLFEAIQRSNLVEVREILKNENIDIDSILMTIPKQDKLMMETLLLASKTPTITTLRYARDYASFKVFEKIFNKTNMNSREITSLFLKQASEILSIKDNDEIEKVRFILKQEIDDRLNIPLIFIVIQSEFDDEELRKDIVESIIAKFGINWEERCFGHTVLTLVSTNPAQLETAKFLIFSREENINQFGPNDEHPLITWRSNREFLNEVKNQCMSYMDLATINKLKTILMKYTEQSTKVIFEVFPELKQ